MKKTRLCSIMVMGMLTAGILAGCGKKEAPVAGSQTAVSQAAVSQAAGQTLAVDKVNWFSDLDTVDIDGEPVTGDIFSDRKLTLINVWATFCSPCVREMPDLEELYQENQNGPVGIVGLLVDGSTTEYIPGLTDEERKLGKEILAQTGVTYPQITVSEALLETDFKRVVQYPTTFFVDRDGNFVGEPVSGARTKAEWKELIEEYLKLVDGEV